MKPIQVVLERAGTLESRHEVHGLLAHGSSDEIRSFGDPGLEAFWRSSMKPFQALPVAARSVLVDLGLGEEALALACASHHGTPRHLAIVGAVLEAIGVGEEQLACGAHRPIDEDAARALDAVGQLPTRIHNNCSGKHAAMLAWCVGEGWSLAGYHEREHPLQAAIRDELSRWIDPDPESLAWGVDGCGVPTVALSLRAMARAYARLGASEESPARAIVSAMTRNPTLISGSTAFSSQLMNATEGRIMAKEGAEGVYCLACPDEAWGAAFKVTDGALRASGPAVIHALSAWGLLGQAERRCLDPCARVQIRNTRNEDVAALMASSCDDM